MGKPTVLPSIAVRNKNVLPSRTPRIVVTDAETNRALASHAETIDAILRYINTVLIPK